MQEKTKQLIAHLRQHRGYIITAFVILVFLLIFGAVTEAGNRIMSAVGMTDAATIKVVTPAPHTNIYIDQEPRERSERADETVTMAGIRTGKRTVLVAREGHYPWMKTLQVEPDSTYTLHPFIVAHQSPTQQITAGTERYRSLKTSIDNVDVPSRETPITSPSGTIESWVTNDAIYARWVGATSSQPAIFCPGDGECRDTITVTPSKSPIRNLAFYKDRDQVLTLAAQDGVYAIEIDPRGPTQNFQPIYQGISPQFIKTGTSSIVIEDNGTLQQFSL